MPPPILLEQRLPVPSSRDVEIGHLLSALHPHSGNVTQKPRTGWGRVTGARGTRSWADTHMNWMTLFKPAISYRLSVSEPPSSRASFPGDREAPAALLPSGLVAPGKAADRGHVGQRPWVGLDPSLLGAREPAPLGGWFLGAARHFSSQGSGQALGPPGRLHLRHQACPLGATLPYLQSGAVSPARQAPGPWGSRAWGCPHGPAQGQLRAGC